MFCCLKNSPKQKGWLYVCLQNVIAISQHWYQFLQNPQGFTLKNSLDIGGQAWCKIRLGQINKSPPLNILATWPTLWKNRYVVTRFAIGFYLQSWIAMTTYNSTYFYSLNVIKWVAKIVMAQFTIYKIIYICNYVTTIVPLCCNYCVIML